MNKYNYLGKQNYTNEIGILINIYWDYNDEMERSRS